MKRFHMVFTTAAFVAAAPAAFAQMNYSVPPPQQERQLQAAPKQDVPNTATATAVHAAVEAPKPTCEDPGAFPGRVGMQTEDRRNKFIKGVETYKTCMMNFVEERKAVIKANETAARAAIDDFNARKKKYADEQEKSKD